MKLNAKTKILGRKIILVPYRIKHVEKYHKWMESEELRAQTASERLTLKEEYEMQQTWLHDEQKCTFIVTDRSTLEKTNDEIESMIGDANIYLKETDEGLVGELGLMIAEPNYRGQGMGKEAALLLMRYAIQSIRVKTFVAVISLENVRSINMFKKFSFNKEHESKVFNEITFTRPVNEEYNNWLILNTKEYAEILTEENI